MFGKIGFTVNTGKIKKNIAVKKGPGLGVINPVSEVGFPGFQWLPPAIVSGHDVTGAIGVAALRQAVTDKLRQFQKIGIVFLCYKAVVQNHGVVLICHHQLLISRHRTEGKEAVGHGRRTQFFLAQFQQPLSETTANARHGTANHVRVGVFIDHAHEAVSYIQTDLLQTFYFGLVINVADQVQAALAFIFHDVSQCNHSTHFVIVHHR